MGEYQREYFGLFGQFAENEMVNLHAQCLLGDHPIFDQDHSFVWLSRETQAHLQPWFLFRMGLILSIFRSGEWGMYLEYLKHISHCPIKYILYPYINQNLVPK